MDSLLPSITEPVLDGVRLRPIEWLGGVLIVAAAFIEARRPAEA